MQKYLWLLPFYASTAVTIYTKFDMETVIVSRSSKIQIQVQNLFISSFVYNVDEPSF